MSKTNRSRSLTRRTVRPGKGGVIVILILAIAVAAGVFAWKSGMIGGKKPADPAPKTVPAPGSPSVTDGGARKSGTGGSSTPKGPSSIFDDTPGSSGAGGNSVTTTPQVVTPGPVEPIPPPPAPAVDVAALEAAARDAERALVQARDIAVAKLKGAPKFAARQAEVDKLEAALKQARASGTAQEKLDASAAWNKARLTLDKEYDAVIATDPAYAAAKAAAQRAADVLKTGKLADPSRK